MARPLKVGIDYFPTDVDIDQDDKVVMVKNKYGLMGMGTVMMLLAKVYKTGYYYHWTEREQELFAGHFGEEVNVINNVVNECIKWGFFDKNKFTDHEVLTSKGIQKRYLLAVERRKDKHINTDYWLLEKEDYDSNNLVNVDINPINEDKKPVNASKSTQSKVNRNKTKEKKDIPSQELFEKFWGIYPRTIGKVDALDAWKAMVNRKKNPEDVITAAHNYMTIVAAEGTQTKHIKHPTTFLNKDRWEEFLNPIIVQAPQKYTNQKEYIPTPEDMQRMERMKQAYDV